MPLDTALPAPRSMIDRLKQRILHGYCVRFHMGLIVTAVVASGVLTSKLLLLAGIHSLRLRYPFAVLASYGVFLLLVRVWIWYVTLRQPLTAGAPNIDLGNIPSAGGWGGNSAGSAARFGGGTSGGGGASDLWEEDASAQPAGIVQAGSGGRSFLPDLDISCDDDGWLVMLLLATLVLGIFCAGGYLVYVAPQVLPEAACQVVLAPALMRVSKDHHHGWMPGVLQSTAMPFIIVCIIAVALGWAAHSHCPHAARLIDVWNCPTP